MNQEKLLKPLKHYRIAKKWTWFTLADRSGVSISTISRAEASKNGWPPRASSRAKLFVALGLSIK